MEQGRKKTQPPPSPIVRTGVFVYQTPGDDTHWADLSKAEQDYALQDIRNLAQVASGCGWIYKIEIKDGGLDHPVAIVNPHGKKGEQYHSFWIMHTNIRRPELGYNLEKGWAGGTLLAQSADILALLKKCREYALFFYHSLWDGPWNSSPPEGDWPNGGSPIDNFKPGRE